MTLRNMRPNAARVVIAYCEACGRKADVNVDRLHEETYVPDMARRLMCSKCGSKRINARGPRGIVSSGRRRGRKKPLAFRPDFVHVSADNCTDHPGVSPFRFPSRSVLKLEARPVSAGNCTVDALLEDQWSTRSRRTIAPRRRSIA